MRSQGGERGSRSAQDIESIDSPEELQAFVSGCDRIDEPTTLRISSVMIRLRDAGRIVLMQEMSIHQGILARKPRD